MNCDRASLATLLFICVTLFAPDLIADISDNGSSCAADMLETTPSNAFFPLEGGAVVRHQVTGLEWRRCPEGMLWVENTCTGMWSTKTWQSALQHADISPGWRLPNVIELQTIVERCKTNPALNEHVFPGSSTIPFWTNSPVAYYGDYAWVVSFNSGQRLWGDKRNHLGVRLVRDSTSSSAHNN